MAKYTGKTVRVAVPATVIADKFADLTQMQGSMDNMPEEYRKRMGEMTFTRDSMIMTNPQVGQVEMKVTEHSPEQVRMVCDAPMHMELTIHMAAAGENETDVTTDVDIDIPAMLKPFIGPHMQKVADEMSSMMGNLAAAR